MPSAKWNTAKEINEAAEIQKVFVTVQLYMPPAIAKQPGDPVALTNFILHGCELRKKEILFAYDYFFLRIKSVDHAFKLRIVEFKVIARPTHAVFINR
jgi:hypothetical protein